MGMIDSSDYDWASCVEWLITGAEATSITLRYIITLSTKMGMIDSTDYDWASCVEWMFTGAEATSITLR